MFYNWPSHIEGFKIILQFIKMVGIAIDLGISLSPIWQFSIFGWYLSLRIIMHDLSPSFSGDHLVFDTKCIRCSFVFP